MKTARLVHRTAKFLSRFLFDTVGAKRKLWKEKRRKGISRSAEREEGYAPSTAKTFEKVLSKLYLIVCANMATRFQKNQSGKCAESSCK
jgi:hypothetical protein